LVPAETKMGKNAGGESVMFVVLVSAGKAARGIIVPTAGTIIPLVESRARDRIVNSRRQELRAANRNKQKQKKSGETCRNEARSADIQDPGERHKPVLTFCVNNDWTGRLTGATPEMRTPSVSETGDDRQ